jgi:Cu(I)/Ag(I) efflux system membrane fusion protein
VVYIAPELDLATKTLQVRVDLANTPDFSIKPGMNATIVISSAFSRSAVSIPDQAVIHSGLRNLAIIARGKGLYEPREIVIGGSAEGYTQIIRGIDAGEEIVVSSQFMIDAESNMKAAVMSMTAGSDRSAVSGDTAITQDKPAGAVGAGKKAQIVRTPEKTEIYTCPMDPEIVSDHPGICPKCKMNLVKKE